MKNKKAIITEPSGGELVFGLILIGFNLLSILMHGLAIENITTLADIFYLLGQVSFIIIGAILIRVHRNKVQRYNEYISKKRESKVNEYVKHFSESRTIEPVLQNIRNANTGIITKDEAYQLLKNNIITKERYIEIIEQLNKM